MPQHMANTLELITGLPLFAEISPRETAQMLGIMKPQKLKHARGQILWSFGERLSRVAVVASGRVAAYQQITTAQKQLICIYETGQIIALEAFASHQQTSHAMIISHRSGELLMLNFAKALECEQIPPQVRQRLLRNTLDAVADENLRLVNKSLMLSLSSVKERVMFFLNNLQARKDDESFDIGMSQSELSQFLAVDRSSLSVALNTLRREGLVDYKGNIYKIL